MVNEKIGKDRAFSIELKSRRDLKNVSLTNFQQDGALVEGTIGELVRAVFIDGVILEVVGKCGVLRIDLGEDEIRKTADKRQKEGGTR
jgi:hypothetical protein